jgi:hypothetical protein
MGNSGRIPLDHPGQIGDILLMGNVIKDNRFKLVTEIQKPDSKKRLSIGMAMEDPPAGYNIYKNSFGHVLDPVMAIPAHEAWLFENKPALDSVRRGLADSAAGRTKDLGSFAKHATEE